MGGSRTLSAAFALVLLSGCALGDTGSPTPTPTSAVSPAPTPTPSAAAACRLPVAGGDAPTDGNPAHGTTGSGGFITFPAGSFTADNQSSGTYDLAARKWLPVRHDWVSPDGTKYAWPEYRRVDGPATGIIHIVDVASGADRTVNVPAPSMPVSWETSGLYITRVVPNSDAPPQGLSVLDPASGALRQVVNDGVWTQIGSGTAYGMDLDQAAAPPPQTGPGGANRVRAVDLGSGAVRNVQTFAGTRVSVAGILGSNPVLILATADRTQVKVGETTLYDQPSSQPGPSPPAIVDGSTLWLSGSQAVWQSTDGQLHKIALTVAYAVVAGACR